MSLLIYNSGLFTYKLLLYLVAPFNKKAAKMISGRQKTFSRLKQMSSGGSKKSVWIHCASLGEFEQGRPIIESLKREFPEIRVLLTFFSPSGYEIKKDYPGADLVTYLPFDSANNAKKFIEMVKPDLAIFVKYEFWYHYLCTCKTHGVPVLLASAIFRESQPFFKKYGKLHRAMLQCFEHIFAQNAKSARLLQDIHISHVTVAGDTRFDRVFQLAQQKKKIEGIDAFKGSKKLMVIGSAWLSDIKVLASFIDQYSNSLNFIIAPHEVHESSIQMMEQEISLPMVRFSKAQLEDLKRVPVLIIDSIGILNALYGYAEFAYIGGAFGQGLHNTLEAATYGMPIFFGKSATNAKFFEAGEMVKMGCAYEIETYSDLMSHMDKFLSDDGFREDIASRTRAFVKDNIGATAKIVNMAGTYLKA